MWRASERGRTASHFLRPTGPTQGGVCSRLTVCSHCVNWTAPPAPHPDPSQMPASRVGKWVDRKGGGQNGKWRESLCAPSFINHVWSGRMSQSVKAPYWPRPQPSITARGTKSNRVACLMYLLHTTTPLHPTAPSMAPPTLIHPLQPSPAPQPPWVYVVTEIHRVPPGEAGYCTLTGRCEGQVRGPHDGSACGHVNSSSVPRCPMLGRMVFFVAMTTLVT